MSYRSLLILSFAVACSMSGYDHGSVLTHRLATVLENKAREFPLEHIITRYQNDYHVKSDTDAYEHAQECVRYLILAAICKKSMPMLSKDVDNFWHTFLLFTNDYQDFCNNVLGGYIHHSPRTTPSGTGADEASAAQFIERYEALFQEAPSQTVWANAYHQQEPPKCNDKGTGGCLSTWP